MHELLRELNIIGEERAAECANIIRSYGVGTRTPELVIFSRQKLENLAEDLNVSPDMLCASNYVASIGGSQFVIVLSWRDSIAAINLMGNKITQLEQIIMVPPRREIRARHNNNPKQCTGTFPKIDNPNNL